MNTVREDADVLPLALPLLGPEEQEAVLAVLRSGWLTTGSEAASFEEELLRLTGAAAVVAVSSCTAALHLALLVAGVQPGDEVVTTPITWPATANVCVHAGATPVFADVDPDTLNLDPAAAAALVTPRTAALLPVHLAGQPVDMAGISALASTRGLAVIEDAAHALGAEYAGRPIGSLSAQTGFSFYPTKTITTAEGGALALTDAAAAPRARRLSRHGMSVSTWSRRNGEPETPVCVEPGFKYNLPDLLAALGRRQLRRLDVILARRARLAGLYREALRDCDAVKLLRPVEGTRHANHLFPVLVRPGESAVTRDQLHAGLQSEGITAGVHYRGLHLHPYYAERYGLRPEDLPIATEVSRTVVSLPLSPTMDEADVHRVVESVRRLVVGRRGRAQRRPDPEYRVRGGQALGPAAPRERLGADLMPAHEVLAVEVGGTTLRAGVVDVRTGALLRWTSAATPNHLAHRGDVDGPLYAAIRTVTAEVAGHATPRRVAVAYAGPIGPAGVALAAPTVRGVGGRIPVADACRRIWPASRVTVLNDLTAAGYRYVASGMSDFCLVTVGSGVGHKVFIGGRPLLGPEGRGGEIGHLRVDPSPDALSCDCGGRGHLGAIASGRGCLALLRRTARLDPAGRQSSTLADVPVEALDTGRLVEAFRAGDAWVVGVVERAAGALGHALAGIHLTTGVEKVFVMGGFALALGEPYRRLVVSAAAAECWDLGQDWNEMVRYGLPDDHSGLIGAAIAVAGAGAEQ